MKSKLTCYLIHIDEPGHFCGRSQLAVHEALYLIFCPTVVDVDDADHVPL